MSSKEKHEGLLVWVGTVARGNKDWMEFEQAHIGIALMHCRICRLMMVKERGEYEESIGMQLAKKVLYMSSCSALMLLCP
jgi:hypothetical protein